MSPRVPALKPRKVIRTSRMVHFSVAHHSHDMKRSTLAKTLERARISLEEFLKHDP